MVLRFYTIPGDPSQPYESPFSKSCKDVDWAAAQIGWRRHRLGLHSYDPDLDLVYFGVGNGTLGTATPQPPRRRQPLSSSVVALRADSGEYVWHYQKLPATLGISIPPSPFLAGLTINGFRAKFSCTPPRTDSFTFSIAPPANSSSAKPYTAVSGPRAST